MTDRYCLVRSTVNPRQWVRIEHLNGDSVAHTPVLAAIRALAPCTVRYYGSCSGPVPAGSYGVVTLEDAS